MLEAIAQTSYHNRTSKVFSLPEGYRGSTKVYDVADMRRVIESLVW